MFNKNPLSFVTLLLIVIALTGCSGTPTQVLQIIPTPIPQATVQVLSRPSPVSGKTSVPAPKETAIVTQENPLAPETNPVGDIPDSQAFVSYVASPGNYYLDAPEGWARTVSGSNVRFINKFDGMSVSLNTAPSAPTTASVVQNELAALTQAGHAFQTGPITQVNLPGGPAIFITATVNSDPDPVTNKQVRLDENIYIYYQNGTDAMLQLWAPLGTDNVDQWKRISESFRWK